MQRVCSGAGRKGWERLLQSELRGNEMRKQQKQASASEEHGGEDGLTCLLEIPANVLTSVAQNVIFSCKMAFTEVIK